ncbi:hypothetical protein [Spirosoma linguale]|uniref:Uncharacterized protein n=1 Tax=Spirosoma linguale (strain ATCC 33905 / DSM 74 / LMG 10896 / Claus 1) TaxID=504472 RepID=D2QT45_SPILD|nr:hypothetical protein Slin_6015 [Spirosoma linguale DSM 74]
MQEITFTQTHNVFLDNGIVALYRYLQKAEHPDLLPKELEGLKAYPLKKGVHFGLESNKLWLHHPDLFQLLEVLYYGMGHEVYDTYTDKQLAEGGNLFFTVGEDGELTATPFPKMNTYGLTELLTNNAQGTTSKEDGTRKIDAIRKENPVLATRIETEFANRKLKLLSKVYFNEPYTKLTRLETPQKAFFESGTHACYLTGESLKRLVDAQNISPFISGISAFSSHRNANDKKISWKALYLSRFAAATCFYQYPSKLRDSLNVYLVYSDNLTNLYELLRDKFDAITRPSDVLRQQEFIANFPQSDENNPLGRAGDFIGRNENLFYLLFTLYNNVMGKRQPLEYKELLQQLGIADRSVGIVSLRAESFAATMRPNQYENLHHVKFVFALIHKLEQQGVSIPLVWQSLKIIKPSLQSNRDRYRMERQFRERFVGKVLNAQSVLADMEGFFNDCYGYLLDVLNEPGKSIGFKRYNDLVKFITHYELIVNQKIMQNEELQKRALGLGSQVGQGILNYNQNDRKTNARQGRKYIIALRKANQFAGFMDQLSRVQSRFTLSISRDLLEGINEDNYAWIKQFVIISALNQVNSELSPKSDKS